MNAQPTATQPTPLPLDPAILATLLQTTLDALPLHPAATQDEIAAIREAAVHAVTTLHPRDPMEAILAARIVATHLAAMDCLRCASQPGLPLALKLRCLGKFATLARLADATRQALAQAQARPALQPATVPATILAPRPQPAPVAAEPARPAPPQPPQRDARPPLPTPVLPVPPGLPPQCAIAATVMPGDAITRRVVDEIAARASASPTAKAA